MNYSLLCPWGSPGNNTGVGCHALLQDILPTQGSNPRLSCPLHWQVGSLPPAPPRSQQHVGSCFSLSPAPSPAPTFYTGLRMERFNWQGTGKASSHSYWGAKTLNPMSPPTTESRQQPHDWTWRQIFPSVKPSDEIQPWLTARLPLHERP